RLAEKRKDFNRAEQALRRAVAVAPGQASRVIDLAKFLAKQGRHQESEQAFAQAEALAPDSPKVLFERAEAYVQSRRNLGEARQLLKRYLKSRLAPEDPPRHQAEKLLKQIGG
ncbi:MAG: tetratricopeptide repeat protein, partial [Acidobacteria bacterium]|nr:tetratricopeptide repeat protein [Acidobacteriota bacterium]